MVGQPRKAQLVEAEFGDEIGRQTITKNLQSKINSSSEISVDSSLLPLVQSEGDISLSDSDTKDAKDKAIQACGGNANDTACIEKQQQQIQQQMLEEKKNASNSTANIIKGRRLRMVVIEDGKRKVYQIPDGQVFNPEKIGIKFVPEIAAPGQTTVKESWNPVRSLPSLGDLAVSFVKYGALFLYALSILVTWQTFRLGGYDPKFAAIPTAIAVIFPYSGFLITIGFFLLVRYHIHVKNNPLNKTQ